MDIGDKGKLCSSDDNLRKLEPYGSFPVKPLEQALAEAQAGNDSLNLQYDTENPTVSALDIFYYSHDSDRKTAF
jgi:hypothetical protein